MASTCRGGKEGQHLDLEIRAGKLISSEQRGNGLSYCEQSDGVDGQLVSVGVTHDGDDRAGVGGLL